MSERTPSEKSAWIRAAFAASVALISGLGAILPLSPASAAIRHHHGARGGIAAGATDPEKDAALVLDGATGRVLYTRNADAVRHPASLTKMMTLYLLFEQLKNGQMTLATPLPVSDHAAAQNRVKLYLRPGTSIPVEEAIKAIVVCSANDVAVAISEAIGGSEAHFAELMTAKARALGMTHTFYHNASGLPDDLQVTTAKDLSILARHLAYDFPQYFPYFSTQTFTWHGETHKSTDHLLGAYEGVDGIKTGYTGASGFNLVSSVVRAGAHVIGVVMGGRTAHRRDMEMVHLLDATFAQINQNPTLVARATVPWQSLAQNAPATPMIAGFQIASAGALPRQTVSDSMAPAAARTNAPLDPEDEDAAESRPDTDDALPNTPPVQTSAPVAPPPPMRTAMLLPPQIRTPQPAPAAPRIVTALPPVRIRGQSDPAVTRAAVTLPQPIPRPANAMILAAYHPQALTPSLPKPRPAIVGRAAIGTANLGIARSVQSAQNVSNWTIQIGAFADVTSAKAQLSAYAERSMDVLGQAARIVAPFQGIDGHTFYRARFGPFPEREAREVCERLTERGQTCFAAITEH
jgi:D-alanyl-D-alanine carboxypeptidase